jgi:hypothetical protein
MFYLVILDRPYKKSITTYFLPIQRHIKALKTLSPLCYIMLLIHNFAQQKL